MMRKVKILIVPELPNMMTLKIQEMKNIPKKIYLQIGRKCPDDCDFDKLKGVTWNKDKINKNDIEYILKDMPSDEEVEIAALNYRDKSDNKNTDEDDNITVKWWDKQEAFMEGVKWFKSQLTGEISK